MTMTLAEKQEFQKLFVDAAATLPARLFTGCRLEWRPGALQNLMDKMQAFKRAAEDEFRKLDAGASSAPKGWTGASPAGGARSGVSIGGHRPAAWQPARPSGTPAATGPVLGAHRLSGSEFLTAAKKAGAKADAKALLMEGATIGKDLAMDAVMDATGATALKESAIDAVVEMIKSSGLIDSAVMAGAEHVVTEVLSVLPLIGAITNLGSGAINGITSICALVSKHKLATESKHIAPGNPTAALHAVESLFKRKAEQYAYYAALDVAAGGSQLAAALGDFGAASGPAIGIGKAVLKLLSSLAMTAVYVREFKAAKKILLMPSHFTASMLPKCPILGAYLITEAETSTLMAFLSEGALPDNWMDLVVERKSHISTVVRLANQCQLASPFILRGHRKSPTAPEATEFKGSHMLDFRLRKVMTRISHEANMIMKRDPRALKFLGKHTAAKFGIAVGSGGKN